MSVFYVEALKDARNVTTFRPTFKVFLAGGITGCPNWQAEVVAQMRLIGGFGEDSLPDILLMNPRRVNFPIHDPRAAQAQIKWEYDHLRQADAISFWFAPETIQPIVLFEYGYWLGQGTPLIVGVDPKYQRREDVLVQTKLTGRVPRVVDTLEDLCNGIVEQAQTWKPRRGR